MINANARRHELMRCPADGNTLVEASPGVHACGRCRGHAVRREAFAAAHREVERILEPERDPRSGAFARLRSCPGCGGGMAPLRIGAQPCWVAWCGGCGLLWIEKLEQPVVTRLERRASIERAVAEMPPEERRAMASEMAGDLERERRERRLIEELKGLLGLLSGW